MAERRFSPVSITQLRKKDLGAWTNLYKKYFPILSRYAKRMKVPDQDIDDKVQDIFADLWERIETLKIEKSIRGYIKHILRNRIIDELRKSKREEIAASHNNFKKNIYLPEFENTIAARDEIIRAMEALTPLEKQIAGMIFIFHFSYKTVAEKLGIPIGTVKSGLHRAKEKLKERL